MAESTGTRCPQLSTLTVGGGRFTAVVRTAGGLVALDIEHLGLLQDRTGMQGLRGWDVYDGVGTHPAASSHASPSSQLGTQPAGAGRVRPRLP
ncbi:hypothetical protein [Streptomyces beijiangensis]|uniref:Uncharacterized protein n=1 Tax=Streptomyces beijiangensis TaxID=163361 RepID=A0A939F8T3_9ACTN|nr:hypothetical protein [Streptomyces beijiangensis]MBO0513729.1 hypothetical protein [Streptomyces beijiangensis]